MSSKYSISITPNQILFPGHTLGEWINPYAFAAIKADGSVVTWGGDFLPAAIVAPWLQN
ncbi:hypothetical protein [Methylocucumis oryzae]|uniref:hypothetical protein n=1 Tax=Methylocucumis oryzae TaxID=1632867 RepID=UPI0012FF4799|nr:hypothetical protein [Methylocucumis oryzae]